MGGSVQRDGSHAGMPYVAALLLDADYRERVRRLEALEADRIYCRHNMAHFMDVARLAWIRNLEENRRLDREMIYLYALLHDMGRVAEYEQGISHAQASAGYAGEIFSRLGYPADRGRVICTAILSHRGSSQRYRSGSRQNEPKTEEAEAFADLMRWADHASRMCFCCPAQRDCKWEEERRNRPEYWI